MSGRCAVPLCRHQIGGYTFPKDSASRKRWVIAGNGYREIIGRGLPTAATTPNIAQRCSYARTKFAQQIQFTVGHLADFDSAYFSESESVKLVYITDIARFTRLQTRLNSSAICRQHRCRGRCRLETTAYCLPIPVSRL